MLSCSSFKDPIFPLTFFISQKFDQIPFQIGKKAEKLHAMIENAEKNAFVLIHSLNVSCLPILMEGILFLNQKSPTKGVISYG